MVLTVELKGCQNDSFDRFQASENDGKVPNWLSDPLNFEDPSYLRLA